MKSLIVSILTFLGIISPGQPISEGQKAPDFRLVADNGKEVRLYDYLGKWIVLYFYPKADTPHCTQQAKEYSKLLEEFEKENAVVFGISTDELEKIREFKKKHNLKVTFLSDPEGKVAKTYGVKLILGMCSRDTVIINPEGIVEKIYRGVDPKADPHRVLEYIKAKNQSLSAK